MVIRMLILTLLSVQGAVSCSSDRCTKGSELEPPLCPLVLPNIDKITIVENAQKSTLQRDDSDCSTFALAESHVRRYFSEAKLTNENDAHYTLDWSPCYASGKVSFADGSFGEWSVNRLRSGTLAMSNGKKMVLYCPSCQFSPFQ